MNVPWLTASVIDPLNEESLLEDGNENYGVQSFWQPIYNIIKKTLSSEKRIPQVLHKIPLEDERQALKHNF